MALLSTLVDNFDTFNTSAWLTLAGQSFTTGKLLFSGGYGSITSVVNALTTQTTYSIQNDTNYFKMTRVTGGNFYFRVGAPGGQKAAVWTDGADLKFGIAGVEDTYSSITYDPLFHSYFRFFLDTSGTGNFVWSTSGNGTDWTTRKTITAAQLSAFGNGSNVFLEIYQSGLDCTLHSFNAIDNPTDSVEIDVNPMTVDNWEMPNCWLYINQYMNTKDSSYPNLGVLTTPFTWWQDLWLYADDQAYGNPSYPESKIIEPSSGYWLPFDWGLDKRRVGYSSEEYEPPDEEEPPPPVPTTPVDREIPPMFSSAAYMRACTFTTREYVEPEPVEIEVPTFDAEEADFLVLTFTAVQTTYTPPTGGGGGGGGGPIIVTPPPVDYTPTGNPQLDVFIATLPLATGIAVQ